MTSASPRCRALIEFLQSHGEPSWRTEQVLKGVYKSYKRKWHHIDGLPKSLRWRLKDQFGKWVSNFKPEAVVEGDSAQKLLLQSRKDEARVEAVSLQFHTHRSLCISSQVGCAFQCAFCATGKVGLKRQLDADEITDQVLHFLQFGQKVDSVSFMGMGEPLGNPKLFDALRILSAPELFGMSSRRLNVSTVGVIPGIRKLTEEFPQVNLAFSLHSPFTEERNKLVPLNRMFPMSEVFDVLDQHIRSTGRRIWICYLLLEGINDSKDHARALAQLVRDRPVETRTLVFSRETTKAGTIWVFLNNAKNATEKEGQIYCSGPVHRIRGRWFDALSDLLSNYFFVFLFACQRTRKRNGCHLWGFPIRGAVHDQSLQSAEMCGTYNICFGQFHFLTCFFGSGSMFPRKERMR
eukprot:s637_g25.t1